MSTFQSLIVLTRLVPSRGSHGLGKDWVRSQHAEQTRAWNSSWGLWTPGCKRTVFYRKTVGFSAAKPMGQGVHLARGTVGEYAANKAGSAGSRETLLLYGKTCCLSVVENTSGNLHHLRKGWIKCIFKVDHFHFFMSKVTLATRVETQECVDVVFQLSHPFKRAS